jgi:single-stranded-DNA-specific exonuclease
MVPLIGENHLLVRFGLEEMAKSKKVGLRALMNLGNFGSRPIADTDIGFYIAPRLNAIGRLQNARMGVELLTTTDKRRAKEIAKKLDEENSKRQEIQNSMLGEVLSMVDKEVDLETDKAIVLASKGWHLGVIGIVASRVVEKFNLPTILLNIEDGFCRGSARSIPSFHIYNGLTDCKGMLMHFGGHKYAAGLTLELSRFEQFREDFIKIAGEGLPVEPQESIINIDAKTSIENLTTSLVEEIMELGPFGPQYPYPTFLSEAVAFIGEPCFVGKREEHVRFEVGNMDGGVDGIGFGVAEKYRERYKKDSKFDIVYSPALVTRNEMSKVVQIRLQDLIESGG